MLAGKKISSFHYIQLHVRGHFPTCISWIRPMPGMQSGTPTRLRSVPRCQSQMPNYLLALKWPPPSLSLPLPHPCILADNAAADGNIIAVRPTPPSRRRAANASNSILGIQWPSIALRPPIAPPHFPVAYLRNGQQRNNYLRPFYFAKTDFPIPLFTAD